jgi:hypothetical protein
MRSNVMSSVERELTLQRVENMRHGQTLYKQLQRETLKKGDRDVEM